MSIWIELRELQESRIRLSRCALYHSALQSLAMAMFAFGGELPWATMVTLTALDIGTSGAYALVMHRGWNLSLRQPHMPGLYTVVKCTLQFALLCLAPRLWLLAIISALVAFAFSMASFSRRRRNSALAAMVIAVGLALGLSRNRLGHFAVTDMNLIALWIYVALSIALLAAIGAEFGTIGRMLGNMNKALSESLVKLEALANQERLVERERISRELHDTLLQGIQGLVLQFQSVAERLPSGGATRQLMDSALERADQVLLEGRDRLAGLRVAGSAGSDLPEALSSAGEELAAQYNVQFRLQVRGEPRTLHETVEDETYRVGREALFNAFQHASASEVVVDLSFDAHLLRLQVRDDGIGIDAGAQIPRGDLKRFGLARMKERAAKLGGYLTIREATGGGTEVVLSVPAERAYGSPANIAPEGGGPSEQTLKLHP